ncbi:hypothetical protein GGR55DRAFT_544734 [Xylaria sp. FL0064]|nr:hypothetical protein GGR55DRAFT_544734 [Xylaria sp. FL0064]
MGKRKKRSRDTAAETSAAAATNRRWTEEEEHQLLAWLDYTLQYSIKFSTTVESHMSVTARAPDRKKCVKKVERLWESYGGYRPKDTIWKEGSTCLGLSDYERVRIRQIRDELEAFSTLDDEEPPCLDESRETSVLTSLGSTPSAPCPDYGPDIQEHDTTRLAANGGTSTVGLKERAPGAGDSQCSSAYQSRSIGIQTFDEAPVTSLGPGDIEENDKFMSDMKAKLTSQEHQIYHLENELSAIRKEHDKLLRDVDRSDDSLPNPEILHKLRSDNSALKRQLQNIRAAQSNELLVKSNTLGPTRDWICGELDWIEDRLAKTCTAFGYLSSSTRALSQESARLQGLITRVSGMSIEQFNAYALSTGISDHQLARSVAAALVCELAFESSFPDSLGSESLILHGYREQLLLKGNSAALESLDLLAHNSLFSDRYFLKKLVPDKSRDLSNEVFKLLLEWDYSENQDQPLGFDADVSRDELFQLIFEKALTVKAKLLLSNSHYTLIFPTPGTEFDAATMRRHTWRYDGYERQRSRLQLDQHKSPVQPRGEMEVVKLCLFPALYAYAKHQDEVSSTSLKMNTKQHAMNYRNFFVKDSDSMTGEFTLISKALVQL